VLTPPVMLVFDWTAARLNRTPSTQPCAREGHRPRSRWPAPALAPPGSLTKLKQRSGSRRLMGKRQPASSGSKPTGLRGVEVPASHLLGAETQAPSHFFGYGERMPAAIVRGVRASSRRA